MSATIYFERYLPKRDQLSTAAPASMIVMLTAAFGDFPVILNHGNIDVLKGMWFATRGPDRDSIEQLMQAIGDKHNVRVWAEY